MMGHQVEPHDVSLQACKKKLSLDKSSDKVIATVGLRDEPISRSPKVLSTVSDSVQCSQPVSSIFYADTFAHSDVTQSGAASRGFFITTHRFLRAYAVQTTPVR